MTELNTFERNLLDDLLEAHPVAQRRARRRSVARRGAVVVTAAAAIVAAPTVVDILDPTFDPSTGVLAIAEAEGGVTVSVVDVQADEAEMNRQLSDAGIPATVRTVPASPFLVGKFVGVEAHGPRGQRVAMQAGQAEEVFVPNGVEPGLVLHVGRTPDAGEDMSATVSAFHPGEIFDCDETLLGAGPVEVEAALTEGGVTDIRWTVVSNDTETGYSPARPEQGALMSANAWPGNPVAHVAMTLDDDRVADRLPPECGLR